MNELVLVLDFGGQYKELIAGVVRNLSVYSEIRPGNLPVDEIKRLNPIGIILTGGPNSVYLPDSPKCSPELFTMGIPILGICYGMQLMCHTLGGVVAPGVVGEYGRIAVTPCASSELFSSELFAEDTKTREAAKAHGTAKAAARAAKSKGTGAGANVKPFAALMSHMDAVSQLPEGFDLTARSGSCIAACENSARKLYGVQFHPETKHTDGGRDIMQRFLFDICHATGDYRLDDYLDTHIARIRQDVGDNMILLALSGGVDSSVCASFLSKALPGQLVCVFVDHGFMRLNEGDEIQQVFSKRKLSFIRVNAQKRFLAKIKGVSEPEAKRKLIGEEFIRVFEEEAAKLGHIPFLAQGTIYPDIVESGGSYGATIKSHHNVGGLPENLNFTKIIEPLAGLFKDEVRVLGRKLGLPSFLVNRQPFPGPGLAIRVMGKVTEQKLELLRGADAILREEIGSMKHKPDQYFAVLTDTRSVGVKGDGRSYGPVIAIRAVKTDDFMTCDYAPLPHKLLSRISSRIPNELPSISRVVYDITSKPPATVEWE